MIESMRIFVTGASGYIGKPLIEQLVNQGHELVVVAASENSQVFDPPPSALKIIHADLSIPGAWQDELDGIDLVFHLIDPVNEDVDSDTDDTLKRQMQVRIDSMFQLAWAIEHAGRPPQGLVIQSSPRATESSAHPIALGFRALEAVTDSLKRGGIPVLINRSGDSEKTVPILLASMGVIAKPASKQPPSKKSPAKQAPAEQPPSKEPPVRESSVALDASSSGAAEDHSWTGPALVLSLDEYLLESGVLAPSLRALLKRLSDRGIPLIFTTARSAIDAMTFLDQLGVGDLVIAGDGSALLDVSSREVVRTELLTADQVMGICLAVRTSESSIGIQIERGRHVYCSLPRPIPERLEWLYGNAKPVLFTELLQRPATRILLHGNPRRLTRSVQDIRQSWVRQNLVKITHYDQGCFGILGPTADRAVALQHAESILGVPRFSSLIFIGEKDSELLHGWKHSCTWAGMSQELRSRVSCIVPAGSPEETFEFLLKALQAIQPSTASH